MPQPIIAITTKLEDDHLPRLTVKKNYVDAVVNAGGIPILVPLLKDNAQIAILCSVVDGILLPGGGDIDPVYFNGKPHQSIYGQNADLDHLELELIHHAREQSIPLLGICRGCQVINVAFGGTLYTDIPTQFETDLNHSSKRYKDLPHQVNIVNDTRLHRIVQSSTIQVNSLHHQAIENVGLGLIVNAIANDGLIEGVEIPGDTFLVGVQWHPEALPEDESSRTIFANFLQAAGDFARNNGRLPE